MAKFNVISGSDGTTVMYSGCPTYNGSYLKPAYLEFREIKSPTLINWHKGDYIEYGRSGYTYYLYDIPQPTKKATSAMSGEAFVYSSVKFYARTRDLEICPFRDLVYKESAYYFSTLNSVSTYENVAGIAGRIQQNLTSLFGSGVWSVAVQSGLSGFDETEAREFTLQGGTCLDALDKIYEVWPDLGWTFSVVNGVHTITIGGANVRSAANTTNQYRYGKGNGLLSLKRTQSNVSEFCTRLYAYGSNRNIITRYYNNLKDSNDNNIYQSANVYIPNLMLPLSSWGQTSGLYDASKAFLDNAAQQAVFGIVPKTVYFDGNSEEEIYPSIKETTIANLRAAKSSTATGSPNYYPSTAKYAGTERLDEFVSVTAPADDGVIADDGDKYIEEGTDMVTASSTTTTLPAASHGAMLISSIAIKSHTFTNSGRIDISPNAGVTLTCPGSPSKVTMKYTVTMAGEVIGTGSIAVQQNGNTYIGTLGNLSFGTASKLVTGNVSISIGYSIFYNTLASAVTVTTTRNAGSIVWKMSRILTQTFSAVIRQVGFDMMSRAALSGNGNPTIAMLSGGCVGRTFSVKNAVYDSSNDRWNLTLYRTDDSSVSMRYPNTSYPVASGDRFVLLDLAMPDEYVSMASQKLLTKAQAYLARYSQIEPFYEPTIDAKFVAENLASHPNNETYIIREGKYMYITDNEVIGGTEYVIIDTLTIAEDESNIPTYKVTLRERKKQSFVKSIEASLTSINTGGGDSGQQSTSQLLSMPESFLVNENAMSKQGTTQVTIAEGYEIPKSSENVKVDNAGPNTMSFVGDYPSTLEDGRIYFKVQEVSN